MPHSTNISQPIQEAVDNTPEIITHPVPTRLLDAKQCPAPHVTSLEQYRSMWKQSIENPDEFFGNVSIFDTIFNKAHAFTLFFF
jgi:acetyl-CoA synthetase